MMAGGYYPGAPAFVEPQDDFEDYMWMENEEEFDKQVGKFYFYNQRGKQTLASNPEGKQLL